MVEVVNAIMAVGKMSCKQFCQFCPVFDGSQGNFGVNPSHMVSKWRDGSLGADDLASLDAEVVAWLSSCEDNVAVWRCNAEVWGLEKPKDVPKKEVVSEVIPAATKEQVNAEAPRRKKRKTGYTCFVTQFSKGYRAEHAGDTYDEKEMRKAAKSSWAEMDEEAQKPFEDLAVDETIKAEARADAKAVAMAVTAAEAKAADEAHAEMSAEEGSKKKRKKSLPKSAYEIFLQQFKKLYRKQHPGAAYDEKEARKAGKASWLEMPEEEQAVFVDQANEEARQASEAAEANEETRDVKRVNRTPVKGTTTKARTPSKDTLVKAGKGTPSSGTKPRPTPLSQRKKRKAASPGPSYEGADVGEDKELAELVLSKFTGTAQMTEKNLQQQVQTPGIKTPGGKLKKVVQGLIRSGSLQKMRGQLSRISSPDLQQSTRVGKPSPRSLHSKKQGTKRKASPVDDKAPIPLF